MKYVLLIFLSPLIIFWPSLNSFFTNDDFFFLKISQINSIGEFLGFFNLFAKNSEGLGMYRPLATQVFYLIKNPFVMHIVVCITFLLILVLIYKLALLTFKSLPGQAGEKIALISTFLYSVSATHFAHFYYLATYQELLFTLFVLSVIISHLNKKYLLSILFLVLGLMSKETAVIAPFLLLLVDWYSNNKIILKRYVTYAVILFLYLASHIFLYGFATGDSYVWNFSFRKIVNSLVWYLVWGLNLPETLVDFIGPGIAVNQNLFKYWAKTIYPIFGLFIAELVVVAWLMIKVMRDLKLNLENKKSSLFAIVWFVVSLTPVIFLPIHKFSFYLTLPLIGIVYRIGYLFDRSKISNIWLYGFMTMWLSISLLTIHHSRSTSWITNGQEISSSVYKYFKRNDFGGSYISLVDTSKDIDLPWSPTMVLKNALSDKNFFYVYFPNLADKIEYNGNKGTKVESRQFLGY